MNTLTKYSLLIWEDRPETHRVFLIPSNTINSRMRDALRGSHHKFINSDPETDDLLIVQAAVAKNGEEAMEGFEEWIGIFIPFERTIEKPIESLEDIEAFYLTGFCL